MMAAVQIPVTVKCRIGIDDRDDYADLRGFVDRVAGTGCRTFIVHARKAVLAGLSPKQNRDIPPLRYDYVYRLKAERPDLEVILNGGVPGLDAAAQHLEHVDGLMFGRAAYQNPYMLARVDAEFFGDVRTPPSRFDVLDALMPYVARKRADGVPLQRMARHILGLFQGQPGARAWRRYLSENAYRDGAGIETLQAAAAFVRPANEGEATEKSRRAAAS
jgi:tRNA-dihydrouridine synthase A